MHATRLITSQSGELELERAAFVGDFRSQSRVDLASKADEVVNAH